MKTDAVERFVDKAEQQLSLLVALQERRKATLDESARQVRRCLALFLAPLTAPTLPLRWCQCHDRPPLVTVTCICHGHKGESNDFFFLVGSVARPQLPALFPI